MSKVREEARRLAEQRCRPLVITDGSPGIGCPVIASITGATLVLAVTEPSLSGLHDLGRVLELASGLGAASAVCVNRADLAPELAEQIEQQARAAGAAVIPRVRYDPAVTQAQLRGRAVVESGRPGGRRHRAGMGAAMPDTRAGAKLTWAGEPQHAGDGEQVPRRTGTDRPEQAFFGDAGEEVRADRRSFLKLAAASAGTVLLACDRAPTAAPRQEAPAGPADRRPGKPGASPCAVPGAAGEQPAPPLAAGLSREAVLELARAAADTRMREYQNCAQAAFLALQEVFGLPGAGILKALTPLPGIAERGETCGAVVAALMALGLVFGRERPQGEQDWRVALVPARAFCERFAREQGSTQCVELLERLLGQRFDLADPAGLASYRAAGGPAACLRLVREAVVNAAELLLDAAADGRWRDARLQ